MDCYREESLGVRLFTRVRFVLGRLSRVAREVPSSGRILDLGCGHGLFTNLLALESPSRSILGIEPSVTKLAVARRSSHGIPNVRYLEGRIDVVSEKGFRAITILDVLYLLPDEQKLAVLQRCRELLADDGVLILKTNDTHPRWKYGVVRLEEQLAVRVIGFTYGGEIHFRGVSEYLSLLKTAGFETQVERIDGWLPVPHRLFICHPIT